MVKNCAKCFSSLLALVALGGCVSNSVQGRYDNALINGRLDLAAQESAALSEQESGGQSRVLAQLENGYSQFWAQKNDLSWAAFEKSSTSIQEYEDRAKLSLRDVGSKLGSFLTNDSVLPYRGSPSDKIFLHTYQALNALAQGKLESAKVELRRARERRKDAIEAQGDQLEKSKSKASSGPSFDELEKTLIKSYGKGDLTVYKDFANPFNILVEGMVFALCAEDDEERVHGLRLLQTLAEIHHWDANIWGGKEMDGSKALPPTLVIIAERGLAPRRVSEQIYLPFTHNGTLTGIHLAIPVLLAPKKPSAAMVLESEFGTSSFKTLADVASIHRFELGQLMPKILWSQVASASAKAIAEYKIGKESPLLGLAAAIYNTVVTQADVRSWQSLPAQYEMALLPMCPELELRCGSQMRKVSIPGSNHALLLIRNIGDNDLKTQVIPLPKTP